jgi:hypothetical protein
MSPNNALEHNDVIDKLQYYVLNSKNIGKILRTQIKKPEKLKKIEKQKVKRTNFFVPNKDDILFWIFYIMHRGMDEFEMFNMKYKNSSNVEKQMKIDYIKTLRDNKVLFKQHKIQTMYTCENDLLNEKIITFKTFFALCLLENINIMYVEKYAYYEYIIDEDNTDIYVLHKLDDGSYAFEINVLEEIKKYYKNTKLKMVSYCKHIQSLSFYKIDEVKEIAEFLKVPLVNSSNKKTKSKQELYNNISNLLLY